MCTCARVHRNRRWLCRARWYTRSFGAVYLPRPPCESNTKVPKFDGKNTYRCSDKGAYL